MSRIYITVEVVADGDYESDTVGKVRLSSAPRSACVGRELANVVKFLALADGAVDACDIAAAFAEQIGVLSADYETAAERAAREAVVTLSTGFDDRIDSLRRAVTNIYERLDGKA